MASPSKETVPATGRKRPAKYLPHNTKRNKSLDLQSGLQGFLITCDGGRERQSCREAIALLERFYDKVAKDEGSCTNCLGNQNASDKSGCIEISKEAEGESLDTNGGSTELDIEDKDSTQGPKLATSAIPEEATLCAAKESLKASKGDIENLLEEEMAELRDKKKARFTGLETGCNGIVFVRMLKEDTGTNAVAVRPNQVVEAIMQEAVKFRKPLTRSCLRFLPVEITCYASADEVGKVVEPFLSRHFPAGQGANAMKFAVVYEARANTNLDRMEIINAVAKLVPESHSVDLKTPDKTIIVQVVKTICAVGVVDNYKQYAKYNLRQLTSLKEQS